MRKQSEIRAAFESLASRIGRAKMNSVDRHLHTSTRPGIAKLARLALGCAVVVSAGALAAAQPAERADRVTYPQVSETACPVKVVSIPGRAGNQVTAVVRQPPGPGRFPAIVLLHG